MLYTDKEHQKAKDVLDNCTFVSPSTKGCYISSIALWIHYCNIFCGGDDTVTDVRLADYIEWMVSSGTAESIRQGNTSIQQVLHIKLQGVACYWRIQNDDRADIPDPRKSHVYMSKWKDITQRYPLRLQPKNAVTVGGTHMSSTYNGNNSGNTLVARPRYQAGMSSASNWSPAIAGPSGGTGSRSIHATGQYQQHNYTAPRQRFPYTTNGTVGAGIYPNKFPVRSSGLVSPTTNRHSNTPLRPRTGNAGGHPLASKKFIVPQVPILPSTAQAHASSDIAPSRASSTSLDYEEDIRVDNGEHSSIYQIAPEKTIDHTSQQVLKQDVLPHIPKKKLSGELPSEMPVWNASADKSPEGYLLTGEEVAALNMRQLEMSTYQQCQARAFYNLGFASWLSVKQRSALTLADVFMDESSTLAIQEQQVLLPLIRVAPSQPTMTVQTEGLVTEAAKDSSVERPIPSSAPATPERQVADMVSRKAESLPPPSLASVPLDSSEKGAPASLTSKNSPAELAAAAAAATTSMDNPVLAATVSPARTISVAIHSPDSSHSGKTQVLRHSNPLLCTWSSLAICFFQKWHVAEEPAPDFESSQWLSEKLFASDFEIAFKEACHDISSDSLSGSEAMSDSAYFYANAFKLTHAPVDDIKGLSCVDAIDIESLLPEISIALMKANAGYSPTVKEPVKAPARFGVIPSQALQRLIFPWIVSKLRAIIQMNSNNAQAQMATRFLSMLKKLRMVILQDVAFLMEVPLLKAAFANHRPFEGAVFSSSEFVAYRAEIRQALGNTEMNEMNDYCTNTLSWINWRKEALPKGDPKRFKPTTSRIMQPVFRPPPVSNHIATADIVLPRQELTSGAPESLSVTPSLGHLERDAGVKRPYDLSPSRDPRNGNVNGTNHSAERGTSSEVPALISKRARHGFDMSKAIHPMQQNGYALNVPGLEPTANAGHEEEPLVHFTASIDELRMENEDLRYQMQRIESSLAQQQSEIRGWMSRIEMVIQGNSNMSIRPRSVSPDVETSAQYHPGAAAVPGQPPSAHLHHRYPAYPPQAPGQQQQQQLMYPTRQYVRPPQLPSQQPQRAYADSRYHQPTTVHRQSSEMVASHGGSSHNEDVVYRGNGGSTTESQAAAAGQGHFSLQRTKPGMTQQQLAQAQAQAQAQVHHSSYSKNPQRVQPSHYAQHAQGYSARRAYADPRNNPQSHYPSATHGSSVGQTDRSWNAGA